MEKQTLSTLFSSKVCRIPDYQRGYLGKEAMEWFDWRHWRFGYR